MKILYEIVVESCAWDKVKKKKQEPKYWDKC